MRRVWADVILAAERSYVLRLLAWSGLSIVLGTLVMVLLTLRRIESRLLTHFALQTILWGALIGAIAGWAWQSLHLRDVGGAAYWFLRGTGAASQGLYVDRPPRALIEALDALFAGAQA